MKPPCAKYCENPESALIGALIRRLSSKRTDCSDELQFSVTLPSSSGWWPVAHIPGSSPYEIGQYPGMAPSAAHFGPITSLGNVALCRPILRYSPLWVIVSWTTMEEAQSCWNPKPNTKCYQRTCFVKSQSSEPGSARLTMARAMNAVAGPRLLRLWNSYGTGCLAGASGMAPAALHRMAARRSRLAIQASVAGRHR